MAYSNGIITRPVLVGPSQNDIASALGISSNDPAYLIANGNINPWAKYKPVRLNTLADTGESCTEYPTYWQAHDGGCGFSIPTNTNPGSGPGSYTGAWYKLLHSSLLWTYQKPTGPLTTWPYRTNDFDGYDHNALPPFADPSLTTFMLAADGSLTINYDMNAGDSRSLHLSDLKVNNVALSQWYYGVLVYYSNSQYTFKATERASVTAGTITFSGMSAYAGLNVTIVPFLSSVAQSQGTASAGTIISLNLAPMQIYVQPFTSGISVSWDECTWNAAKTQVSYSISLINQTSSSITIQNIVITIKDSTQTLYTRNISSVTVPANSTRNIASGTQAITYDPSEEYMMTIISSGSSYIPYEETQIEEAEPDEN